MSFEKRKLLMKSFIEAQFSYCPLTWMFHDRWITQKINRLHERALRIVYKDDTLTFSQLLEKDQSVTMHIKNIRTLAVELYKVKHGLSPKIMDSIFLGREASYLCTQTDFFPPQIRTVHYGEDSLRYFGPKIWNIVPNEVKGSPTLELFQKNIKKWNPKCTCRLCKTYIKGLGYVTLCE